MSSRFYLTSHFRVIYVLTALIGCLLPPGITGSKAEETSRTILAIGDSLIAGYGLSQDYSFTARLEAELESRGVTARVHNAGVSGDTSSGGRSRLAWVLSDYDADALDLVILEFGANDALRGIDPAITRRNMDAMLKTLSEREVPVLVAGMLAPPNLGDEYGQEFNRIYPDLTEKYGVDLYPFFLDGVAAIPELNQDDGIHPNEDGVDIIVEKMAPAVIKAIRR